MRPTYTQSIPKILKDFATKINKHFNEPPIKVRQSYEAYQFVKDKYNL